MSHGRASSLYDHLDHCFVVLKMYNKASLREEFTFEEQTNIIKINLSMNFLSRRRFIRVSPYLIILMRVSVKNCDDQIP